ncbi:MAG: hypothetical protein IPL61_37325 [Myxococcales bacterium]|nr:hypothetical protein [Myxococcales bacterium]
MTARVVAVALCVALAVGGCGRRHAQPGEARPRPTPEATVKISENGPVKATVKVWPPAPQLGDPLYLELTIEAAPGVTVAAPFEDEGLGRFAAVGWVHDTQRRDDGGTVEVQTYTLEPPGSGKHRIPPFRLLVTDARASAAAAGATSSAATELLTEEIPIAVAPVDPARAAEALAPARGRLAIVVGGLAWWLIAGLIAAGLIALGAIVWGVRAYRRQAIVRTRISAYEIAVRRLAALERGGAPDDVGIDDWFVELSAVVRHYLEDRFALRAPELTTEEFLQVARRAAGLSSAHRELLSAFLETCDRVKFAGYRPTADESLASLAAARAFIEDTRHKEAA